MERLKLYVWRNLIAWDQGFNTLFGGLPGQTLSARAATARRDRRVWGCVLCKFLDWISKEHCFRARLSDIQRARAVIRDVRLTKAGA